MSAESAAEFRRHKLARRKMIDGVWVAVEAPDHGTPSTYDNWGCRCQPCKDAANRTKTKRWRRTEENGGIAPVTKHGSATTYENWGCQCRPCLDAHAARGRRSERRTGAASSPESATKAAPPGGWNAGRGLDPTPSSRRSGTS